VLTMHLSYPIN